MSTKDGFKKIAQDGSSKKFFVFIGGALVLVLGYLLLAPANDVTPSDSRLRTVPGGNKTVLGGEVNEVYEQALREADRQRIEDAKQQGASAIPSIIGNRTQEQNPIELTIEEKRPEVVRPGLPVANNQPKEVVKIELPTTQPKDLPTNIELPKVDKPLIQPKPTPIATATPVQAAPAPVATPAPTPAPKAAPAKMEPQVDEALRSSILMKMNQIAGQMDANPGSPQTQYFYEPPANVSVSSSSQDYSMTTSPSALTIEEVADGNAMSNDPEVKFPLPGQILYAQLKSRANSDAPGPILAEIIQGDLAGTTLLGSFSVANEALILQFNTATITETLSGQVVNDTFPINAIAVDTKYIGTALATDVDRHLFERIAVTFATSFIGGFGELMASSGGTTITQPDGTVIEQNPTLTVRDQAISSAGQAVGEVGGILNEYYGNKPTTVIVESGTPIGLLFLQ